MKNHFPSLLIVVSTLVLICCSGNKQENANTEATATDTISSLSDSAASAGPTFTVDDAFRQQLSGVFTAYLRVKDAFVASNAANVKVESGALKTALAKTDMKLLTGAAHNDWMTYLGTFEGALKQIDATTDIEKQRKAFTALSDGMYKSIKAYGLQGQSAYYEFCPMAFNNEGAYWLSDSEKIRNPYFGDQMLTCGSVKEKLN